MGDTSEVIRQQMKDTRVQLSEKLIALESQFSETVHSTATLVHATVEAVQETVEAVTGAVGDSLQSVKNAREFRRQINRHPLLVVGGAAVLGYLAVEFMAGSKKKSDQTSEAAHPPSPFAKNAGDRNHKVSVESAAFAAAYQAGRESSSRYQLQEFATRSLIGVVQDITSHVFPKLIDSFANTRSNAPVSRSDDTGEHQR